MAIRKLLAPVAGLLAGVLLLAACSSAATPVPQSDAEKAVCTAVQTWSDEMRAFADLDAATASVEDVQAQRDKVSAAWDDVKTALQGVSAADTAAVTAAGDTLQAALTTMPTDVPIDQMIAGVKTAADPLKAAYKEMADGMDCKIATPY